jgi:uncharacterized protein
MLLAPLMNTIGSATRFSRFELRTSDVEAARDFYSAILGAGDRPIVELAPEAVARGARPMWLGSIGVDDLERVVASFVDRGATRLGPARPIEGGAVAMIREAGGAILALTDAPSESRVEVAWHVLYSTDVVASIATYRDLFGWHITERLDLGAQGVFHQFAWRLAEPSVGAMADLAGRPGVHPQWLFHFRVASLDTALAIVLARGARPIGPFMFPDGRRVAVCDDPQGAAFALVETA